MAEKNEAAHQGLQESSMQEVVQVDKSLHEGRQNTEIEFLRKGRQTTEPPPPQLPPQSISGIFPYEDVLTVPPPAPTSAPASAPAIPPPAPQANADAAGES